MVNLRVTSAYRNHQLSYEAGSVITVSGEEARSLFADSPGSFELYEEPIVKAVKKPKKDKRVKRAKKDK